MFQKLKDGANKLKAKIGGDELDEKLVAVVSQENWQASTQQLHEVAQAAYNYQKWARINEFIWQKLKKSKSWKKILKTFNLIDFLLKNGPPSIISNFKYDLYQLRTFQSYSNYVEGIDKGQPIREKAKAVVNLIQNEEFLEEERVKAKNIREKMSNVIGGSAYSSSSNSGSYGGSSGYGGSGGYGGGASGYGGSGGYGTQTKKKTQNNTYNYGNSLGTYGDYTYDKSTLDKYKQAKNDKNTTSDKKQDKKPDIVVQTKKPFEKIASKLSKPGEKKAENVEEPKPVTNYTKPAATINNPPKQSGGDIIDFFDSAPAQTNTNAPPQSQPFTFDQPQPQPQVVQPQVQKQQPVAPTQVLPQQQQQPQQNAYQPPQQQPFSPFSPPQQQPFSPPQFQPQQQPNPSYGQQPQQYPVQQPAYNQFGQPIQIPQPNQYGQYPPQYAQQNQYGQQQQFNQFGQPVQQYGQPQLNQYGQPNQYGYPPQQAPTQAYNPYANPLHQQQTAPAANTYKPSGGLNSGITLNTAVKKDEDFGNFSTSATTAQNVNWLSSTEKGLIDFSDFGSQIKKDPPKQNKSSQLSNNIQIDAWSW